MVQVRSGFKGRTGGLCYACFFFLTLIGLNGLGAGVAFSENPPVKAAVLISQNIRPYIEAADGVVEMLKKGELDVDTFLMDKFKADDFNSLKQSFHSKTYTLLLTVGPQASSFGWALSRNGEYPVIYTMVLNPEKLSDAPPSACGISLSIPLEVQLKAISETLPSRKQIGLMYDPGNNAAFYDLAERLAADVGMSIIPLKVTSRKAIAQALAANWGKIDSLWLIPDRTIISESIVRHIIKEALLNATPVIGYNRFFYESGAAMSFVFDYKDIGMQTGRLALKMLESRQCETDSPLFQIWINERVMEKLGLPYDKRGSFQNGPSVTGK